MRAAVLGPTSDSGHSRHASLRETELHHLWLEQRFPPGALATVAGQPVRVLYRGRPGAGPGPDFRDARISVGGAAPRLGDVELHVTAPDFRRHGHASDPAYGRVLLHVVFDAQGEEETALPGGGTAPVLALLPWVERRAAAIAASIEGSVPWREPCYTAVARLGAPAVLRLLQSGGEARLRAKAERLAAELADTPAEHVLYRALCGALGLSHNVEPFRTLADRAPLPGLLAGTAPLSDAEAEQRVQARLRAVAGFGAGAAALGGLPWRLESLRPNAHPAKRIDALAALLIRQRVRGLAPGLQSAAAMGASALLRALQAPGIGRERAVELAINAVLPFLIATGDAGDALALATSLPPAAAYGTLAVLTDALDGREPEQRDSRRSLVMSGALAQQGALVLHRDWCRRGGCGVCPLS